MNIAVPTRETVFAALSARLPDGGLLTRDDDLARYRRDWLGRLRSRPARGWATADGVRRRGGAGVLP